MTGRCGKIENIIRDGVEYYDGAISGIDDPEVFRALTSLRRNALSWYPFRENLRILDAGCGCGALTGLLLDVSGETDAVDIDPECAEITKRRYAGRKGLNVINGDILDLPGDRKYDCIVAAELLEELTGDAVRILKKLKDLLNDDGTLLLFFRNRNGIRYSSGARDEYVKSRQDLSKLHTKEETAEILKAAGFTDIYCYYPVPDMIFTQTVFSDGMLPRRSIRDRVMTYDPYGEGSCGAAELERDSYDDIIRNGRFADQANVILMECRLTPYSGRRALAAVLSGDRERSHAFNTVFYDDGKVRKYPVFEESRETLGDAFKNLKELRERGLCTVSADMKNGVMEMPFVDAVPLTEALRDAFYRDPENAVRIFRQLYDDILRSSEYTQTEDGPVLKKGYIDMIPYNAFLKDGRMIYFDQEFTVKDCPASYIMFRAIFYTYIHIPRAERFMPVREMYERFGILPRLEEFLKTENEFTGRNRNRELFAQVYRWAWGPKKYGTGFVMGVFDLFHAGHLNLLRRAKSRCSFLRVGVLSDELVYKYKKIKPEIPLDQRIGIIEAMDCADEVVAVEGEYVSKIAEWYKRPYDCFFSGDDYAGNEYWKQEKEELKKLGAEMEFFPYTDTVSSTRIREELARLKEAALNERKDRKTADN
ncbi:MAG: adenylyltransferase/cytidyltransferase family protein [Lachnospiraceae bacterium]|nr:adenylyltransferase/cytidyltransferase family protein [Lachnospiraceae bacterium]